MTEPRIVPIALDAAAPEARATLDRARREMGMLPNLYRVLGHSPASLAGYDGFARGLDRGMLPKRVREQIALVIATDNGCEYCLAAHRITGRIAKLSAAEIASAERGIAVDAREQAALTLARELCERTGDASDGAIAGARDAGWSDADLVEIAAHVALNVFTNTINRFARTPIDFGRVARATGEVLARFGKG